MSLQCPNCKSVNIAKDGTAVYGACQDYKCRKCGNEFRYDKRPMPTPAELKFDKKAKRYSNPYSSFSRGINKELVERRLLQ